MILLLTCLVACIGCVWKEAVPLQGVCVRARQGSWWSFGKEHKFGVDGGFLCPSGLSNTLKGQPTVPSQNETQ